MTFDFEPASLTPHHIRFETLLCVFLTASKMSSQLETPDRMHPAYVTSTVSVGILMGVAIVCLVLRFIHRCRSSNLWWDDWAILGAFVTGAGAYVSGVLCAVPSMGAAGYHIETFTISRLNMWAKVCQIRALYPRCLGGTNDNDL